MKIFYKPSEPQAGIMEWIGGTPHEKKNEGSISMNLDLSFWIGRNVKNSLLLEAWV